MATPLRFTLEQAFDGARHRLDFTAQSYLKKVNDCPSDVLPAAVPADGNCLYHSVLLLMNDPTIGVAELRGLLLLQPASDNLRLIYFSSGDHGIGPRCEIV